MKHTRLAPLLLGIWACSGDAAYGQPLADPMRPPNVMGASSGEPEPEGNRLQSVLLSPGRRLAIINGETVRLGGSIGGAVVTKITESEVVLKYPDRIEVLKLLGDIERKRVRPGSVAGRAK